MCWHSSRQPIRSCPAVPFSSKEDRIGTAAICIPDSFGAQDWSSPAVAEEEGRRATHRAHGVCGTSRSESGARPWRCRLPAAALSDGGLWRGQRRRRQRLGTRGGHEWRRQGGGGACGGLRRGAAAHPAAQLCNGDAGGVPVWCVFEDTCAQSCGFFLFFFFSAAPTVLLWSSARCGCLRALARELGSAALPAV